MATSPEAAGWRTRVAGILFAAIGLFQIYGYLIASGDAARYGIATNAFVIVFLGLPVLAGIRLAVAPQLGVAWMVGGAYTFLFLVVEMITVLGELVHGTLTPEDPLITAGCVVALYYTLTPNAPRPETRSVLLEIGGVLSAVVIVVIGLAGGGAFVASLVRAMSIPGFAASVPWLAFWLIVIIPTVAFIVAAIGERRAGGRTFRDQAAANRRLSWILLLALVGVLTVTIQAAVILATGDPASAVAGAVFATVIGVLAAIATRRFGAEILLDAVGATRADPVRDRTVLDVAGEVAVAAGIPPPAVWIVHDLSENAFSTGTSPSRASLVVTDGLVQRLDREELQAVVSHEIGHIRNQDTLYGLYVAVMVGIVATITDGAFWMVVEGWRHGWFVWTGRGRGALSGLVAGLVVGAILFVVTLAFRIVAPFAAFLVRAAVSREREFLADATAVDLTRNPAGLERALAEVAKDSTRLGPANRGMQHLWFRNPVAPGRDGPWNLLATHPTFRARIDRLRVLEGLPPMQPTEAAALGVEA